MSEESTLSASDQLRREIYNACLRFGQESDITVYQTLGVLEIVKLDLIEAISNPKENQ